MLANKVHVSILADEEEFPQIIPALFPAKALLLDVPLKGISPAPRPALVRKQLLRIHSQCAHLSPCAHPQPQVQLQGSQYCR